MANFLDNVFFIFERLNWLSVLDILLVALIFFALLYTLRDTQAMVLLRGAIFLVITLILLTSLFDLPAFSWLVQSTLPALLLAIPVIFAPEIRRALERLGRAGTLVTGPGTAPQPEIVKVIHGVVEAARRLSARQHGALIVLQRNDNLDQYAETGVQLHARVTPELVGVVPQPVGPPHLGVDERHPGAPVLDPRQPADRNPVQAQPVADQGPRADLRGADGHDPEVQPGRGQPFQVERVGEEGEDLVGRPREPLLPLDQVDLHPLNLRGRRGLGSRLRHPAGP